MTAWEYWPLVRFTLWIATLSNALVFVPGLMLAWVLARCQWPGKTLVETVVMLPLFMPPVATGLLLLLLLGRHGWVGRWLPWRIIFTWQAVVVACAVMSFPLFVRAARTAFAEVDPRLEQIARTLGAGEPRVFFTITLPLAWAGILSGVVLAFARALGEFGATVIVAGMIPGKTVTLSLEIYRLIQLGRDEQAVVLLCISTAITFGLLWLYQLVARARR